MLLSCVLTLSHFLGEKLHYSIFQREIINSLSITAYPTHFIQGNEVFTLVTSQFLYTPPIISRETQETDKFQCVEGSWHLADADKIFRTAALILAAILGSSLKRQIGYGLVF